MAHDESALRQYFEGKERLSTALLERNQLLRRLEALSQIPQREETFIHINIHAEQCSEPRVEIRGEQNLSPFF